MGNLRACFVTALVVVLAPGLLAGPHDPVDQEPLTAAEAQKRFKVPEGFEVRLFASEPDVVNPVAMTWDERGRLWVLELYEYPKGAKPGEKGRDKVKVLEDTDADGKADKVTVFADGFNLATGLAVGNGGVWVGQAPHLYFLKDTNGDDVADTREVVLTGFGLQDRHELLNNFCWGPDGWMYMTQGVFTHSVVKDPLRANDPGIKMNAAVARFDPRTKKFEVWADGMSNQWGVDFDAAGNAFCSACVIDHLFHVVPGGYYVRQAGQPGTPYAYDLLRSIVNHRHHMAAYSGIQVYQGDQWPEKYRGTLLMGNIHGNRLNHDKVTARGSSFVADDLGDFLLANDGWFRPVAQKIGPDGTLWVMDWYDSFPCYQTANANPEGLDRRHGRIWRIVWTGQEKGKAVASRPQAGMDLGKMNDGQLVELLGHANVWQRREAQRLLTERKAAVGEGLKKLLAEGKTLEARMAALWTLHSTGAIDAGTLDQYAGDQLAPVRTWVARITGERGEGDAKGLARLMKLAGDEEATVRAGVARAAQQLAHSADVMPIVGRLLEAKGTAEDAMLPQMIWMAAEAKVVSGPKAMFEWMAGKGPEAMPASGQFLRKMMRRIRDAHGPASAQLAEAVALLETVSGRSPELAAEGVRGLIEGYKKGDGMPPGRTGEVLAALAQNSERVLAERAQNLSALWGSQVAGDALVKVIADSGAGDEERIKAMRLAPVVDAKGARMPIRAVLDSEARETVKVEAIRALGAIGNERDSVDILNVWPKLSPAGRRQAAEVLAQKPSWAAALLKAIEEKKASAADVPVTAIRTMSRHGDVDLTRKLTAVVGKFTETPQEKAKLIEAKKRVVLGGPVNLARGKELFAQTCAVCHVFHGEGGAQVGPDITGVGRATLDMLLANIVDPSQVIGRGYENTVVHLKDNNILTGRIVEETADHVKLLMQGPKEETVARKDIKRMKTEEISLMPEGLIDNMSDQDVRDLVWYVFAPPGDAQEKPLRVEVRDKRLVVMARPPGKRKLVEVVNYVIDPELRPYLHPVFDPSGSVVLTEDKPADHPWQHGIFTGLHAVNGLDFWTEKQGRQRFVRLTDVDLGAEQVTLKSLTEWVGPDGKVVLDEGQTVTVHAMDRGDLYRVDFTWGLRPREGSVTVGKYDFGGLSVRLRSVAGHTHLNSNGEKGKATGNKEAAWCNVANPYDGKVYGIAVFDHPQNLGHPSKWRVDGQGMINPSPSLKGQWMVEAGRERVFKYRLVVHAGEGDAKVLGEEYGRFAPAAAVR